VKNGILAGSDSMTRAVINRKNHMPRRSALAKLTTSRFHHSIFFKQPKSAFLPEG
jgi:hypothetical protein